MSGTPVSYGSSGDREGIGSFSRGERETHVKHTFSHQDMDLVREELQLIQRKLRLWLEGRYRESRTAWIGMRITPTLKEVYNRAPSHIKTAARRAFESVLASWFLGSTELRTVEHGVGQPVIYNMNINVNTASAEVNVEVPERLIRALEDLVSLLDFIAYKSMYPESVKRRAARGLEAISELRRLLRN